MNKKALILSLLIPFFLAGCSTEGEVSSSVSTSEESASILSQSSQKTSSGSSSAQSSSGATIAVTSVKLDETTLSIFDDDEDVALTPTISPSNASNQEVTWTSSKTSVATVIDGKITPVGLGTTTITVYTVDGNKAASCTVTVKEAVHIPDFVLHGLYYGEDDWTDKQMVINPASRTEYMIQGVSLCQGDVFKIHMASDQWYGYSKVKSSTKSGLVTAATSDDNIKVLTTGVYDIYCNYTMSDGGNIYIGRVDETEPISGDVSVSGISLSNTGKYLLAREEFTITATIYPNNATNKDVTWTSSDNSIATVTSGGRVVANKDNKKGTATITAKTSDGNFTATCLVYASGKSTVTPDYCLVGKISGYTKTYFTQRYSAIPLSTGRYLIPDVDLIKGDYISVLNNSGGKLKTKTNQDYKKEINENMSVNVYLNANDANKNYLTFENKYSG